MRNRPKRLPKPMLQQQRGKVRMAHPMAEQAKKSAAEKHKAITGREKPSKASKPAPPEKEKDDGESV